MNEVLTRIRKVFLDSGKNQTEIGNIIGKTSQYVWKLLNNDNANPSESVIRDVCREFNVNKEWLRNGTGDMYNYIDTDDYSEIVTIIGEKDPKAKKAIIEYYHLTDGDKEVWWSWVDRFLKGTGD